MYVPLDKEVPDNILEIIRIRLDSGLHSLNALLCNVSVSVIFYLFFFVKKYTTNMYTVSRQKLSQNVCRIFYKIWTILKRFVVQYPEKFDT